MESKQKGTPPTSGRLIGIVPGGRMQPNLRARLEQATWTYALSRNRLAPGPIAELLAPGVVYESQDVVEPLVGRAAVLDYLERRYAHLAGLGVDVGRVDLGEVALPSAVDHPCGIFSLAGVRRSLAVVTLAEDGTIARLDFLSVAPPPSAARFLAPGPG